MKIIHTADLHLGAVPDAGHPWAEERAKDLWQTFARVVAAAEEEQADLLLIAGDLFHRQPLKRELKEADALFSRLTHTRVVLIAGNHDYISPSSNYRQFNWCRQVTFFGGQQLQKLWLPDFNATVYGRSYHAREDTGPLYPYEPVDSQEGIHILVAHGGDDKHCPYTRKELAKAGFDYVALGHIHKPDPNITDGIVTPGALEPIDSNDYGPHGYILAELTKQRRTVRFIPCAAAEYVTLSFQVTPDTTSLLLAEEISSAIEEKGTGNIYKITLTGRRDADIQFSRSMLSAAYRILEFHDETDPDYDFDMLAREHQSDLLGAYIRALRLEENGKAADSHQQTVREKALYYGAKALLDTMKNRH